MRWTSGLLLLLIDRRGLVHCRASLRALWPACSLFDGYLDGEIEIHPREIADAEELAQLFCSDGQAIESQRESDAGERTSHTGRWAGLPQTSRVSYRGVIESWAGPLSEDFDRGSHRSAMH